MSVRSLHAEYVARLPEWERARDVIAGEDAVKGRGEKYLPRLDSQSDAEFAAYVARAMFFNATGRTCAGLVGQIFRKAPAVRLPEAGPMGTAVTAFRADVDLCGRTLEAYARDVVEEVVAVGRAGTLVDWDEREGRAYFAQYAAERILNWRTERRGGRRVLSLVVLSEDVEVIGADGFEVTTIEQLRVLRLNFDAAAADWFYEVELWRERETADGQGKEWFVCGVLRPLRLGRPLAAIPFVFHGPSHGEASCEKLPLADVIALNLDHYRLDADYKHGCHYTALPTAWASGFDKETVYRIGSGTAWQTETPGATAGFLEFTGKGLGTFENAMTRDETLMAVLGARVLEGQKMVGESAQAIALRHAGQDSILATLAVSLGDTLSLALRWVAWWHSTSERPQEVSAEEVGISLNTDFSTGAMPAREIFAVVAAWQAGAISHDGLVEILRRGEVLPADRLDEAELAAAEAARRVSKAAEAAGGLRELAVPVE